MKISTLTIETSGILDKLLEDLEKILSQKSIIFQNAQKEIDRMNKAINEQRQLDIEGERIGNIQNPQEAQKLKKLIEKSRELSTQINDINLISREYNNELDRLSKEEEELREKIKNLSKPDIYEEKEEKRYIEALNSNVIILDKEMPQINDSVIEDNCEIIRCDSKIANEIRKQFSKNVTLTKVMLDNNEFDKLKQKVDSYNYNEKEYFDKQLKILTKVEEPKIEVKEDNTQNINEQEKVVIEEKPIIIPNETNDVIIDSNEEEEEKIVNEDIPSNINIQLEEEKNVDNVVPLSSIIEDTEPLNRPDPLEAQLLENIKKEEVKDNKITLYTSVKSNENMNSNKILNIKDGRKEKVLNAFNNNERHNFVPLNSALNNNNFNSFENFASNKAA